MQCPKCKGALSVNTKGQITCPQCDNLQKRIDLIQVDINDFTYYRIKKVKNFKLDTKVLLAEDVQKLIDQGVEVFTEEE
jgi:uncharacterized Zn finger protein (UPF0148 family)